MILRFGPITIMSSKVRVSYAHLAHAAYQLHQTLWYADDPTPPVWNELKRLDSVLSDALSRTPPEDIH